MSPYRIITALFHAPLISLREPPIRRRVFRALWVNTLIFLVLLPLIFWGATALGDSIGSLKFDTSSTLTDTLLALLFQGAGFFVTASLILTTILLVGPLLAIVSSIVLPIWKSAIWRAAREHAQNQSDPAAKQGLIYEASLVLIELRRLFRLLLLSALAFMLQFIPSIGAPLYLCLQALIAARSLGWDLLSYHFESHGLNYRAQKRWLRQHPIITFSLGGVALFLLMVPFVQVYFSVTNVVAAGLLSPELDRLTSPK